MIPIDTIVVPQGAEYQAVCRGLKKSDRIRVISIPIGVDQIEQILSNYLEELAYTQKLLIVGLCGSLSKQYSVGNVVLYQSCWNLKGQQVNLKSALTDLIQQQLSVDLVTGLTSDRIVFQAASKLQLAQTYPASVVDMEGYDYIKKLQERKIDVAILRVVSDDLTGDIPDLSRAIDRDGKIKARAMAIAFLRQPTAAMRLIRGSLTGLKVLERVVCQLNIL